MASSRETALALAQRYRDRAPRPGRSRSRSPARSRLRHLGITSEEALLFERLASRVLYADGSLRPAPEVLARSTLGQEGLWPHGVSGDVPILLVRVVSDVNLARAPGAAGAGVLASRGAQRGRGHPERAPGQLSRRGTAARLAALLDDGPWRTWQHKRGGAYLLRGDRMAEPERLLLQSVARAVLVSDRGTLAQQLDLHVASPREPTPLAPLRAREPAPRSSRPRPGAAARARERIGGFADGGREYVIVLEGDEETPMPWANVIASPALGTVVTASGSAFTWSENSRENRLTPFANDPVSDPTSEAILVRDDDSGEAWSPTPGPLPRTRKSGRFVIRHGAGVTRFARATSRIRQALDVFVDAADR